LSDQPEPGQEPEKTGSGEPEMSVEEAGVTAATPASNLSNALEPPPEGSLAEAYHRRARLAEDRLAEVLAAYRKLKTENESHRQRVTKNLERRYEQRIEALLVDFIDILDNFDRALEATEQTYAGNPLIDGLILVRTQLLQMLQDQGLERIPALGRPFDPAHSEAVQTQPVDDPDHHHVVVKELLRGYRVHGRVVRPSRVVVGEHAAATGDSQAGASGLAAAAPDAAIPTEAPSLEPSLEEIIDRAEAQEALFPQAFGEDEE